MNYLVRIYSGRLDRKRYGFGLLLCSACIIMMGLIGVVILGATLGKAPAGGSIAALILALILLPTYVVCLFAFHARRFHDLGKSGWYSLICATPYIGFIAVIYLLAKKGQEAANEFGEVPSQETKLLNALLNRT